MGGLLSRCGAVLIKGGKLLGEIASLTDGGHDFIDGQLFANRWQYDVIVRIDPSSGRVTGRLDLAGLLTRNSKASLAYLTTPGSSAEQHGAVLNGIAWDAARRRLLVTGKLWPHIFELKIDP